MYAIVEIAGQQFKVEEGKKIFVHRLDNPQGENLEFDRVLLVEDNENILVGEPTVKDYIVEGKVIDHVRGDKVIVFKKKKKKGYRVKTGHRQNFTQIEITGIGEKGKIVHREAPKARAAEPVIAEATEPAAEEKKPAAKKAAAKKAPKKEEKTEQEEAQAKPKTKKAVTKKEPEKGEVKKSTRTKKQ
jgi:large subunit ribosomal protein L21